MTDPQGESIILCDEFLLLPQDSWYSLLRIFDWFGDHQHEMRDAHGPGHWNDPDQVPLC